MDGLAALGTRIAEINTQLFQLSAGALRTTTTVGSASRVADLTSTSAVQASGSGAPPSFDAVLLAALSNRGDSTAIGTTAARAGVSVAASPAAAPTATGTAPTRTTHQPGSGRLTSSGVPVELAGYGNGRVPDVALEPIGGGHRLWAPAAEAFQRLTTAASRAGISIGVADSYRSYSEQVSVARRKGLYSQGGLAAKPGTSEHGWGKSVDLRLDAAAQRWMRSHASSFGFTENVSREPWHWTYAAR